MTTIEELKQEMLEAESVYIGKRVAYEEAQKQQMFDRCGLKIGDVVISNGVFFKLSRTDSVFFYGHKKTKTGWHKSEQFIHPIPTKVVDHETN